MRINNIVNEFQNYTYNDTNIISSFLNDLKNSNRLDEDDLNIREYLLPEVMTLLNKAVLNRLSADLLFQKNYWSWGFVTLYYSNFFLSQVLNRLNGDFFVYIPLFGRGRGRKNIKLTDGKYKLSAIDNAYRDSHGGEFKKLKESYTFLLTDSTLYINFLNSILDINESTIRSDINYKLKHYREFSFKELRKRLSLEECEREYKYTLEKDTNYNEFKLLKINISRFNLVFNILNKIKNINSGFEVEYDKFLALLDKELSYKFNSEIVRKIENNFNSGMHFHTFSTILEKQLKGAIYEI